MHPPKLGLSLDKPAYFSDCLTISGNVAFQFSSSVRTPRILLSYHCEVRNGRLPLPSDTKELLKRQKHDSKQKEKEDFGDSEHTCELKVPLECKANELNSFPFEMFIGDNLPPSLETELQVIKHKAVASLRVTKSRNAGKWGVTVEIPVIPIPPPNSSTMVRELVPAPLFRNDSGTLELAYNKAAYSDGKIYLLLRYLPNTHPVKPGNHPPLSVVSTLREDISYPQLSEKESSTITSIVENLTELDGTIKLLVKKPARPDYNDTDIHIHHDVSITVEFDNSRQNPDNIFHPISLTVPIMILGGPTPSDFRPPSPTSAYLMPSHITVSNKGGDPHALQPTTQGPPRLQSGYSIKSHFQNDPRIEHLGRNLHIDRVPVRIISQTELRHLKDHQDIGKHTEHPFLRTNQPILQNPNQTQVNAAYLFLPHGEQLVQAQWKHKKDTENSCAAGPEAAIHPIHPPRPRGRIIEPASIKIENTENMYRREFESTGPRTRVLTNVPLNDQSRIT